MRVSLVTPSYNQGRFIAETMDSVLSQKGDVEYIVVDGGSTDESLTVISQKADRLTYWVSEPDGGQYAAINKGFAHSSGEIMGWLNADDVLLPHALETVATIFRDCPQVDWITSLHRVCMDAAGISSWSDLLSGVSREAFLDGCFLSGSGVSFSGYFQQESTFWRRSLWEKAGSAIPDGYGLAGDFALWMEFLKHSEPAGFSRQVSAFRIQPNQRSGQRARYEAEARRGLADARTHFRWRRNLSRAWAGRLRLQSRSVLGRRLAERFGYSGMFLDRSHLDPQAPWAVSVRSFLP